MTPFALQVLREVAKARGITVDKIISTCRLPAMVYARADVARQLDARGYTCPQIGAILNRDHSTIHYALGRGKKRLRPEKLHAAHLSS